VIDIDVQIPNQISRAKSLNLKS